MFIGEYQHAIDSKNRIIIPTKFRDGLGSEFIFTKGLDGCLYIYTMAEWTIMEEKLKKLPLTSKDAQSFCTIFLFGS